MSHRVQSGMASRWNVRSLCWSQVSGPAKELPKLRLREERLSYDEDKNTASVIMKALSSLTPESHQMKRYQELLVLSMYNPQNEISFVYIINRLSSSSL